MTPSRVLQALLGVIVALAFCATVAAMIFFSVDPDNKEILLLLIGQLSGAFVTVIGFAFGSSVGSQRKDELKQSQPQEPNQ